MWLLVCSQGWVFALFDSMTPFLIQHYADFVLLPGIVEMNMHTKFHKDSTKNVHSRVK